MHLPGKALVLIGFMGAGKSTVGRELQTRTRGELFDLDEMISARFALSIAEIFAQHGEAKFREFESAILRDLEPKREAIVVCGGGIILRAENRACLRQLGKVIWLTAPVATLEKRLEYTESRPLLVNGNRGEIIARLLTARTPFYREIADLEIDTSLHSPAQVAQIILGL